MAKAFFHPGAALIEKPGYYFNTRQCKLARLHEGDKLPDGAWEHIADLHEMTSSQVVRKLLDMKPGIDPQLLSYTVHGLADRKSVRLQPKRFAMGRALLFAAAFVVVGLLIGRSSAKI